MKIVLEGPKPKRPSLWKQDKASKKSASGASPPGPEVEVPRTETEIPSPFEGDENFSSGIDSPSESGIGSSVVSTGFVAPSSFSSTGEEIPEISPVQLGADPLPTEGPDPELVLSSSEREAYKPELVEDTQYAGVPAGPTGRLKRSVNDSVEGSPGLDIPEPGTEMPPAYRAAQEMGLVSEFTSEPVQEQSAGDENSVDEASEGCVASTDGLEYDEQSGGKKPRKSFLSRRKSKRKAAADAILNEGCDAPGPDSQEDTFNPITSDVVEHSDSELPGESIDRAPATMSVASFMLSLFELGVCGCLFFALGTQVGNMLVNQLLGR